MSVTTIPTAGIADTAVSTSKILNDAVGNTKLDLTQDYAFTGTVTGAGGGKIGQVIQTVVAGIVEVTSSSGTYVDLTGFSASITPSATSSKILINCSINYGGTSNIYSTSRIVRGSTAIGLGDAAGSRTRGTVFTSNNVLQKATNSAVQFLDSPSTTSATTYKLQITLNSGAHQDHLVVKLD